MREHDSKARHRQHLPVQKRPSPAPHKASVALTSLSPLAAGALPAPGATASTQSAWRKTPAAAGTPMPSPRPRAPQPPLLPLAQLRCCCLSGMTGVAAGGAAVRAHHQGRQCHGWVHPTPAACASPSLGGSQARGAHGCHGLRGPRTRVADACFGQAHVCVRVYVCALACACVCACVCARASASVLLLHAQAHVYVHVCEYVHELQLEHGAGWHVLRLPVLGAVGAVAVVMGGKWTGCMGRVLDATGGDEVRLCSLA